MDQRIDVLGLGCAAVDDLLYVDAYPAPDSKAPVRGRERHCGGLTFTALVAAARMDAAAPMRARSATMTSRRPSSPGWPRKESM